MSIAEGIATKILDKNIMELPKYSGQTHDNTLTTQGLFVRLPLHGPRKRREWLPGRNRIYVHR